MKMPKLPQTTKPKSKVTKPDDEQSVTGKARSSKHVEESDEELWEERESRPKEDRFGKRPKVQVYKNSPTRSEKKTRLKRSRSRQTRKRSPASETFVCDDGCKVEVRKRNGKIRECGKLCFRQNVHGIKDCECRIHINERQSE